MKNTTITCNSMYSAPEYLVELLDEYNAVVPLLRKLLPSDTICYECTWDNQLFENCGIFHSHSDVEKYIFVYKKNSSVKTSVIALNMFKVVFDDWIDDIMNLPDDFINLLLEVIFTSKYCATSASEIFEIFEECFEDNHNETAINYINKIEFSDTRADYVDNCIKLFRCFVDDEFSENYSYSLLFEHALNLIDRSSSFIAKIDYVFSQLFSIKILTYPNSDIVSVEIEEYPW